MVRDDDLIRVIKINVLTTNQQFAACKIIGNEINILFEKTSLWLLRESS